MYKSVASSSSEDATFNKYVWDTLYVSDTWFFVSTDKVYADYFLLP